MKTLLIVLLITLTYTVYKYETKITDLRLSLDAAYDAYEVCSEDISSY